MQKGFSLIELITVIVILGILATLGLINYNKPKEDVLDREAKLNLKVIRSAELTYYMDNGTYYPNLVSEESDIGNINTYLRLSLPTVSGINWSYTVYSTGCAKAKRTDSLRSWYLRVTDNGSNPAVPALDGEPNDSTVYTCP